MKLTTYQLVSLAGLLHDIGKIRQRAGYDVKNKYNFDEYCPIVNNHTSYLHVAHTAEFLDEFCEEFGFKEQSDRNLVNIASYHHKRDSGGFLAEIIRVADRLSSGYEREESKEQGSYNKDRLESIFSQVWLTKEPKVYYYPLQKLDFNIIPYNEKIEHNSNEKYRSLYDGFLNDVKKIPKNVEFDILYDALEYLLEIYGWSVPSSSYYSYPRISLFDHSKTTAAIVQALYGYCECNDIHSVVDLEKSKNSKEFLLVKGDFSGIQEFIFSKIGQSNRYAAKILRARSFYVALSLDLAAYNIISQLNLTKAAILMNIGGKFTLLLPNTDKAKKVVDNVEKSVNDYFFKMTFGETRFVCAYEEISRDDFKAQNGKIGVYEAITITEQKLGIKKYRPQFNSYVFDDYLDKMKVKSDDECKVCDICGKHIAVKNCMCEYCDRFQKIGEKLVKSRFYAILPSDYAGGYPVMDKYKIDFSDTKKNGKALQVFDLDIHSVFDGVAKSKITGYVPRITKQDIGKGRYEDLDDEEEVVEGSIKTFSMIAHDSRRWSEEDKEYVGDKFLGILKADLDYLGKIFIEIGEIKEKNGGNVKNSISKYVSLSRMINFFFIGWLQYKIKSEYPSIYTVFSGGDDLFLIGPFNQIVDLSKDINEHLKQYTKNDDFHISCGIYFAKSKIPVYQMAFKAESALEKSKDKGRNRITIFGRTVEWNEFDRLLSAKIFNQLQQILDNVGMSFVYSLYDFVDRVDRLNRSKGSEKSTRDLLWRPLFVYQVYRNLKERKKMDKQFVNDFLNDFIDYFEQYKGDFYIALNNFIYRNRRRG